MRPDEDEDEEDRQGEENRNQRSDLSFSRGRNIGAAGGRDDPVTGRENPRRLLPLAKRGKELVLEDPPRKRVGEAILETVADLDARPPVGDRNQKQDAVVFFLLTQTPGLDDPHRQILDRLAVEGGHEDHDHLVRALALERGELPFDRRFRALVEHPRVVVDAGLGLCGDVERSGRRHGGHEGEGAEERDDSATDQNQNFTCGTLSAPASASKNSFGPNPLKLATSEAGKTRIAVL